MFKKLELKKHALTAISYMLPLVVASGLLIAIGNLTGGGVIEDYSAPYTWSDALTSLGIMGMGLLPPFIAGYVSYSIADRPGLAPGFLMGCIAKEIGAGFLGGMLGGYLVGYFVLWLKHVIRVPKWAEGLVPMMIITLIASLVCGLLMFFVIGVPIVWLTNWLTEFLIGMQGASRFVFGAIMGAMASSDFGGPINKVASLFADGLLLEGIQQPEAIKVCASMVPPFGVSFCWLLSKIFHKPKFSQAEEDNIAVSFPMGLCMITEGVIPIAMNDIVRVVVSCCTGAAVAGGLLMTWNVGSPVPSGGVFVIPAMSNPLLFTAALLIGSAITGIVLFLLKKKPSEAETEEVEEEMDLSDIHID